jgi:hypothetical protein
MASDKHEHEPQHPAAQSAQSRAATDKAAKEAADERAEATIGAQIILDYNSDGGKAARGGLGATIEENIAARDAHLIALGLNPAAPSGPPSGDPWEPPVVVQKATQHVMPMGTASKVSSLAAGITEVPPVPPPPARA